ncbi:leucine--tRNA ligase [Alphaproteobacteria bacterium endosymbiont of Tiliacea citrago]|uniref:leucine--tRNA ligase n=1 Tax=Alphaproteobacteria bacterium endosymbiont of Tiliacea citrago TaxID=3077944 RepID=UPI00313E82B3
MSYNENFKKIETISKKLWDKLDVYSAKIDKKKEKMVVLDFFPYPSGVGLHVGHTLGYIATDIFSRFYRLKGKNVLHAMGYDAFGLPAEQFAIENKQHPSIITYKNIDNIKAQLKTLGLSLDENRTFNTTDADYYKWTQYIFLKLYNSYFDENLNQVKPIQNLIEKLKRQGKNEDEIYELIKDSRLAYLDEVEVNWCPKLGTVLSNEEVIGGLSERGSHPVIKKPLKQWMFRITKLAERLVENLDELDWPVSVKEMQKNWISLSYGHEVTFECSNGKTIKAYTTRLDTLGGVTYCAISKKHPDIKYFYDGKLPEGDEFPGILTNILVKHPIKNETIPLYIADYVLSYGTSAVMGVPAHDERDINFAQENNLKIIAVVQPNDQYLSKNNINYIQYLKNPNQYPAFCEKNKMINGNTTEEEINFLETNMFIKKNKYMKLRDWVFSRQRYWGEPFPIVLDEAGNPYAIDESQLPVELPYTDKIKTESESDEVFKPLDDCKEWKNIKFIKLDNYTAKIIKEDAEANGSKIHKGTRETNTMPNWAGSCWYYLRYMDNKNKDAFIGEDAKNYWETPKKIGSVDLYLGGAEHAVLHLLYARFWHICLHDLGILNSKEPFQRLFNQGMILGPAYSNENGTYFSYNDVKKIGNEYFSKSTEEKLTETIGKIGKRYKNGVTPEEICNQYSIDGLRLFMMYLGPLDQSKPWDYSAIKGMVRLLDKVYALKFDNKIKDTEKTKYDFNNTLNKIEEDIINLRFNTAISAYIIFINSLNDVISANLYKKIIIIISAFAPHLAEFLYQQNIKEKPSIILENWPKSFEKVNYTAEKINLVLSLNGKKIDVIEVLNSVSKENINLLVEQYCKEHKINFQKIVIPDKRNFWCANIVKKV